MYWRDSVAHTHTHTHIHTHTQTDKHTDTHTYTDTDTQTQISDADTHTHNPYMYDPDNHNKPITANRLLARLKDEYNSLHIEHKQSLLLGLAQTFGVQAVCDERWYVMYDV